MKWIRHLWARFTRRKSYRQVVENDHPIAMYLWGHEDFIGDESE